MQYRTMAGEKVSLLGYGTMRFPTADGKIDETRAEALLDRAYKGGVNYFDTAYGYHDGASEPFVGRVMQKYPRDSFFFATKLPIYLAKSEQHVHELFEEQLSRLRTDYVDFYLIHTLDAELWDTTLKFNVIPYLEEQQKLGRIHHLGFSFHDSYDVFEKIVSYRKWDFCQIQFNYMDTEYQAGERGHALAEKLGVPMVIMEPVRGGALAALPEEAEAPLRRLDPERTPASWALRWVADHSNVKVVLSGMGSEAMVDDNINTMSTFNTLTGDEQKTIANAADVLKARTRNRCTGCRYCMPCPAGVDIPRCFKIFNEYARYKNLEISKASYGFMPEEARPTNCRKCGKCEASCPQHISIRDELSAFAELMK